MPEEENFDWSAYPGFERCLDDNDANDRLAFYLAGTLHCIAMKLAQQLIQKHPTRSQNIQEPAARTGCISKTGNVHPQCNESKETHFEQPACVVELKPFFLP